MNTDIVDTDTQNRLTVPAGDLKPYPLSQNDKPANASSVDVPTQEPVVTNTEETVSDALHNAAANMPFQQEEPEQVEVDEQNLLQSIDDAKNLPQEESEEEQFSVREDSPEEQLARKLGKGNKQETVFFEPETGKNIIANKDDYDRARFEYLSGAMKSAYLKRTHNYSDMDEDLYMAGNSLIKTVGKMIGGMFVDAATATGSLLASTGAVATGAAKNVVQGVTDNFSNSLKLTYLLNKSKPSDYDSKQIEKMISSPIFGELKAKGASPEAIREEADKIYQCPVKYKISEKLAQKANFLESNLNNPMASFAKDLENAKNAYNGFRKLNTQLKETLGLNPDEYDAPTLVYWGNVVSSTVLCAAGAFAGGMGWIMPAMYAAMEWDDAIAEGLQNGKSFEELLPKSYAVAAASLATERLQILSAIKRYKGMRHMMTKGLAAWAFENTAQEVMQDAAIMGTKQITGINDYSTMDYLAMVPETALAALVSSVPMGVIIQHNKIKLAKAYMASGMSEQRALTLADFVMEQGVDAINENPKILKEFTDSLSDILKTSKVIFARNAMDESRAEVASNEEIEQRASDYAATENESGKLVGIVNTKPALVMADKMVGYRSEEGKNITSDKGANRYGLGSMFSFGKGFNLTQFGQPLAQKLKRIGEAKLFTVSLPERSQMAEAEMPLKLQGEQIQNGFSKALNVPLNAIKELTPNQIYDRFGQKPAELSKALVANGVKGMIVKADSNQSLSGVVFDDDKDIQIIKSEPIATGKQQLAQPFANMTKEQLENMSLEEFLKHTKMSRLFKEPENGKFAGIANTEHIINSAAKQLENTNLFTREEAMVIAKHLVMLQYVNGVMFGDGPASINTILETLPTFANTFMASAFNRNGEYADFWRMAVGQNSIFSYDRGTQTNPKVNEKLLKKVFGNKTPTIEDLKEFAVMVRKILTGEKYSGRLDSAYNYLSTELEKETVFRSKNSPRLATVLRTLVGFEARLQRSSSEAHSNRPESSFMHAQQYSYQGIQKDVHMVDLAILRVFGLWKADKTDSSGFWNNNRDNSDLFKYYNKRSNISVANETSLVQLWNNTFNKELPAGITAPWRITDAMIRDNSGGYNARGDSYDVIFLSFATRPATAVHEAGHEVLYIALDVVNRYKMFAPQKAVKIIKSFEKVYEKNYGEKIDLINEKDPKKIKQAHELFAQLYSTSLVEGHAIEGDEDFNEMMKIVARIHGVIRNPSVDQAFVSSDEIINDDAYLEWNKTWAELNRKESAPALLEARQKLMLGYDKTVGMNLSLQEGINQALEDLDKLPSSPTTMVAKYQLQQAAKTGNPAYVLQANATLVNGAVEEMFGVKLVNQNLVDAMTKDNDKTVMESLSRVSCAIWEPLKNALPKPLADALEKMYVSGSKFYDEANAAMAKALQEDGYIKSFVNFARKALQPLSRTAKQLSPRLHYMLKRAVYVENRVRAAFAVNMNQFFSTYDQMEEADKAAMDAALFDQDWRAVENIFAKYNDINIVRGVKSDLEAAYSMLEEADPDETGIRITKDYFPRSVKDMDAMLQYMMNKPEYRQTAEAIMQQKMLGEEAAALIAKKYGTTGKVEAGKNRHALERSFIDVPEDLRQFYATPREALQKYFDDVAAAYGNFTFFGKGANKKMRPDTKGEVTLEYIDVKTGKKEKMTFYAFEQNVAWAKNLEKSGFFKEPKTQADRDYNKKVAEVIEGVFFRKSPHPFVTVYRTVNNIATINNFFTAMSNLVDFAITTWRYNPKQTAIGAVIAAKGESGIEYKDLMTDLYAEFDMDSYKLNRIFNKVFSLSGFTMLDMFGKQSSINAALGSAREKLLSGDQEIIDKIYMYFGGDQNLASACISDIMNGKLTDNVRFFAFNELSEQQPLTLLEVPYYYNLHPNMRVFYQFKTFMLKQADFFVHDVLMKKMQTKPLEALKDAVAFMALLAMFGVPKELIKAMFMGQSFDLSDEVVSQMLGVGLINKYSYYNFKNGNIVKGAGAMIIPPMPVLSRLGSDLKGLTIGKKVGKKGRKRIGLTDVESVKDIPSIGPIGGEALYWWFGGGSKNSFNASL